MNTDKRNEILDRVASWLATWPEDEPLPAELDPRTVDEGAAPPDLATMAAAVAAASQQVKLLGKASARLAEEVHPLHEQVAGIRTELGGVPERLQEIAAAALEARHGDMASARIAGLQEVLADLLDLHDRLRRCGTETRRAIETLPWFARRSARPVIEATVRGIDLVLARLGEVFARHDVRRFESTGRPFDPETMRAIDRVPAGPVAQEGAVAETTRDGFMMGDRLLRPAEVRVAR